MTPPRRFAPLAASLVATLALLSGCAAPVTGDDGSTAAAQSAPRSRELSPLSSPEYDAVRNIVEKHDVTDAAEQAIGSVIGFVRNDVPDGLEIALTMAGTTWLLPQGVQEILAVEKVSDSTVRIEAKRSDGSTVVFIPTWSFESGLPTDTLSLTIEGDIVPQRVQAAKSGPVALLGFLLDTKETKVGNETYTLLPIRGESEPAELFLLVHGFTGPKLYELGVRGVFDVTRFAALSNAASGTIAVALTGTTDGRDGAEIFAKTLTATVSEDGITNTLTIADTAH